MSTTSRGREAEDLVAELLAKKKHKVIVKNWRTRRCEIDIVSIRKKVVYFTEVKYRSSSNWGEGMQYVTAIKLKQMRFAAEIWMHENNWSGDALMMVASVDGEGTVDIVPIDC